MMGKLNTAKEMAPGRGLPVDAMERKGLESALRLRPQQGRTTGPGDGDLAAAAADMSRSRSGQWWSSFE
jgi:hypothetical protein